jgi:hypothetical protein
VAKIIKVSLSEYYPFHSGLTDRLSPRRNRFRFLAGNG